MIKVVNKYKGHNNSINYHEFLNNQKKWKDGNYEFTNVDLSSWIEIVGRIYNVKISLEHGQATKNLLNEA
jgi:hypothetical protein